MCRSCVLTKFSRSLKDWKYRKRWVCMRLPIWTNADVLDKTLIYLWLLAEGWFSRTVWQVFWSDWFCVFSFWQRFRGQVLRIWMVFWYGLLPWGWTTKFRGRFPMLRFAHFLLICYWGTVLYHGFDEFSNDVNASPVASVDDDISFSAILGELFCEVIDEVALLDGWAEWLDFDILDARAYSLVSYTFSCCSSCISINNQISIKRY